MTRSNILLALAILGAGGALGHAFKRSRGSASPLTPAAPASSPNRSIAQSPNFPSAATWKIHGNLTLSDLIQQSPGPRRMAEVVMWLPRATPEELQQFWQHLTTTTPRDHELYPLLMGRWMELAPEAALAATAGTPYEAMPWTAWGKVNPELAVQEAKRRNCGYLAQVLEGAATVQPELVRRLLDQHPGMFDLSMRSRLAKGLETDSWQSSLQLWFHWQKLEDWARDEPGKAWDWALANPSKVSSDSGYDPWARVVGPMLETDPAQVDAILAKLPDGRVKSGILAGKAKALARTDPAAALAMADAAEPGAPRRRLLEEIGPELLESDPDRSLKIFRELAAAGIEETVLLFPGEERKNDQDWLGFHYDDWVDPLLKRDPSGVMDGLPQDIADEIADSWRNYDFKGYAAWLAEQPPGLSKDVRVREAAGKLASGDGGQYQEDYPAAFEWVGQLSAQESRDELGASLIGRWMERNPAEAAAYFAREDALLKSSYEKLKQGGAKP